MHANNLNFTNNVCVKLYCWKYMIKNYYDYYFVHLRCIIQLFDALCIPRLQQKWEYVTNSRECAYSFCIINNILVLSFDFSAADLLDGQLLLYRKFDMHYKCYNNQKFVFPYVTLFIMIILVCMYYLSTIRIRF